MIDALFLLVPVADDTGVEGHCTLGPHMLHTTYEGNGLIGPSGMRLPLVGHLGQGNGLLRRQHVGFERDDDINSAPALQVRYRCPIEKATIFEEQIAPPQHWRPL